MTRQYSAPVRLVGLIAFSIFFAEALIMLFLSLLPTLDLFAVMFLDAVLLVTLLSPVIYFFLFRPLVLHVTEREKAEKNLQLTLDSLETRIKERTAQLEQVNAALEVEVGERTRTEEALRQKEERLWKLTQATFEAIAVSEKGALVDVNDNFLSMFGYTREETLGKMVMDFVVPHHRELIKNNVLSGYEEPYEVDCLRKDGGTFPAEARARHMMHGGKEIRIAAIRDITSRKAAERALREAEAKYRSIFENAIEGVYQTTPEGRYITANPALARILGYESPEELIRTVTDIQGQFYVDQQRRAAFISSIQECGNVLNFESQVYRKDGTIAWISENAREVRDDEGKLRYYEGTTEDITDRTRAEEERRLLEQGLQEMQKVDAVGKLAGGLAHEFNNILMSITSYCELSLMKSPTPELQEILRAAHQGAALMRQLLAFGRKQILAVSLMDINGTIRSMQTVLRSLLGEKTGLTLELSSRPALIKADPGQMEQMLINLSMNANEAMPHGGELILRTALVDLSMEQLRFYPDMKSGRYVMLSIADTGVGMDEATLSRIFEPFFTTKEVGKGTGLGLSSVYGIVRQSGGQIEVQSNPGKGTTFRVYLPYRDKNECESTAPCNGWESFPASPTILLVDDNESLQRALKDTLEIYGYQVLTAANGKDALAISETPGNRVDLLMSDIIMPSMGGQELANRMLELHPHIKILFMSGYSEEAVLRQGALTPGSAFLQKPARIQAILDKIERLLNPKTGK